MVAGEAEHDFQPVVIVDVNAYQEKAEQIGLELLVLDVAFPQHPQSGDQIVTVHFDLISLGGLYLGAQLGLLRFQFQQAGAGRLGDDAGLNGLEDVLGSPLAFLSASSLSIASICKSWSYRSQ